MRAIGGHIAPTLSETDLAMRGRFITLTASHIFNTITKNMDGFMRYSEENGVQKYFANPKKRHGQECAIPPNVEVLKHEKVRIPLKHHFRPLCSHFHIFP
jgi:hypothetical protein